MVHFVKIYLNNILNRVHQRALSQFHNWWANMKKAFWEFKTRTSTSLKNLRATKKQQVLSKICLKWIQILKRQSLLICYENWNFELPVNIFSCFSLHHSHLGKSRLPAYYNQMFRLLSNEGENQWHIKWINTVAGKCKSILNYTFVKHAIVNTGYCCQISFFITFSVSWSGVAHELSLWPLHFRMLMHYIFGAIWHSV